MQLCSLIGIDLPNSTILYKILVSVLNRPFLHKQYSKSSHSFCSFVIQKVKTFPVTSLFHLREICDSLYGEHTPVF